MLVNKNIIVAVTGGIACYKSLELVRRLRTLEANVRVVMTKHAQAFVTPMSFQALSGELVHTELFDEAAEAAMGHIELAKWADLIVVAPATANFIAKLRYGFADDLLMTICLATSAKIALAPAMNQQMWRNSQVTRNVNALEDEFLIWGPASGEQACGDVGAGRMLEAAELAERVCDFFNPDNTPFKGRTIVITAGPTREAIDPVRYISNHSSGKMGYALAEMAVELGAKVELVSGPVNIPCPAGANLQKVTSAKEMLSAVEQRVEQADVFIACAAVADYHVEQIATQKIKKSADMVQLELKKNPDILAKVAKKFPELFCVGFAAETENIEEHALSKLNKKHLRMICANDVSDSTIGFNAEENCITVFFAQALGGGKIQLDRASKHIVARNILHLIAERLQS